jgi:hypothetical protein
MVHCSAKKKTQSRALNSRNLLFGKKAADDYGSSAAHTYYLGVF